MRRGLAPCGAALAVAALAALGPPQPERRALELESARGALSVSRPGAAILTAANMRPGQAAAGELTVRNRGARTIRLALVSSAPRGRLGEALELSIAAAGAPVAAGGLGALAGCHELGALAPGARRRFRFVAAWPRRAAGRDNAYAATATSVDERWLAGGCGGRVARAGGPRPRLALSHRRVLVRRSRARLRVRCVAPRGARCRGTLALRPTSLRRRPLRPAAGAARFDVRARARRTLWLPAPLRGRRRAVALAVVRPARGSGLAPARRYVTLVRAGR